MVEYKKIEVKNANNGQKLSKIVKNGQKWSKMIKNDKNGLKW